MRPLFGDCDVCGEFAADNTFLNRYLCGEHLREVSESLRGRDIGPMVDAAVARLDAEHARDAKLFGGTDIVFRGGMMELRRDGRQMAVTSAPRPGEAGGMIALGEGPKGMGGART